jgi:hypothetical protein
MPCPGDAGGAAVRALVTGDAIYIEVSDEAFVTRGSLVDRLDVELSAYGAKPSEIVAWQLFMDGRLVSTAGAGGSPPPRAEVSIANPTTRRFRLAGAGAAWRRLMRLTYVDTDDGKTERLRLLSGSVESEIHQVPSEEATCVAEGGSFRVRHPVAAVTPLQALVR